MFAAGTVLCALLSLAAQTSAVARCSDEHFSGQLNITSVNGVMADFVRIAPEQYASVGTSLQ